MRREREVMNYPEESYCRYASLVTRKENKCQRHFVRTFTFLSSYTNDICIDAIHVRLLRKIFEKKNAKECD